MLSFKIGSAFFTYDGFSLFKTVKKSSIRAIKNIVIPIDMLILGIQKGISMSIGITIFLIALIDDFFTVLNNEKPSYVKNADPILKDNI
jgi:hypothetical protein